MVFRAGGFSGKSFLLFVAVALWPWLAAQEALQRATVSLASYAGLIRKVAFPHEIVVYASVSATLLLQFAGYLIVLVVLAAVRRAGALRGPADRRAAVAGDGAGGHRPGAGAGLAAGLHSRHRARPDADADDPDVPDADPLPDRAGPGRAAAVGRRPIPSPGWSTGCATRCSTGGSPSPGATLAALAVAAAIFAGGRWVFLRLSPQFEDLM